MADWRNRIIEIKQVSAAELKQNPLNWRKHPAKQTAAIKGLLNEVGIVDTLKAYYSQRAGGALTLVDGRGVMWRYPRFKRDL